jgi:hypothetical protein
LPHWIRRLRLLFGAALVSFTVVHAPQIGHFIGAPCLAFGWWLHGF